jgi:serine acetyltransferase
LVAAGAVVVKDVAPYLMVAGVPAAMISEVPKEHRKY